MSRWYVSILISGIFTIPTPSPVPVSRAPGPASETLRQHLERRIDVIQHRETSVKAFIDTDFASARQRANELSELSETNERGPLYGKVVAVKDNIHVAGFRTTAGAALLAKMPPTSEHSGDAPVVTALRSAGAIVIGTTNMDTWARGVRGVSEVRGQTANPLDLTRNAGGSSAGSAAAVAAGMVDIAIGTDTCGSIRYPASSVRIYGLRPTWTASNREGVVPLAPGQDVVGPLAVTVADLRVGWSVLSGSVLSGGFDAGDNRVPTKRLGLLKGGGTIDSRWLAKAKRAGFVIVDVGGVPSTSGTNLIEVQFPIAKRAYLMWRAGSGQPTWLRSDGLIGSESEMQVQRNIFARRAVLRQALINRLGQYNVDALIQPVTTALPAPLGASQKSGNCMVSAGAGLPALAVPGIAASSGSPLSIGVELIGRPHDESTLLDLADLLQ
jgi:amidase